MTSGTHLEQPGTELHRRHLKDGAQRVRLPWTLGRPPRDEQCPPEDPGKWHDRGHVPSTPEPATGFLALQLAANSAVWPGHAPALAPRALLPRESLLTGHSSGTFLPFRRKAASQLCGKTVTERGCGVPLGVPFQTRRSERATVTPRLAGPRALSHAWIRVEPRPSPHGRVRDHKEHGPRGSGRQHES